MDIALTSFADSDQPRVCPETDLILRDELEHGIVRLTMNRAEARNALSLEMIRQLMTQFESMAHDDKVRVVILAGAGPCFCAGHDLKELRANPDIDFHGKVFSLVGRLMLAIADFQRPVIAEVQGIATAAGCQLVATADIAIAAEDARFATPGVNIGLFCSTPMVALSRAVSSKHAMEMLLTGDMIGAKEAERIGLINRAVPASELTNTTMALAHKIAGKSIQTLKIGKGAFYRQLDMDLKHAYDYAAHVMTENMQALDAAEGIDAFLQKRKPVWQDC
ncbi:enoyl-CoA hydratase [Dongia deserti]|uniref:enoyl-CoA hydratase n=1 Tax=Dongia deserti TaxID=2268030 RepID=UPI000E6469ED|nr:enoyl-CoA hydratase [Dongia deserti]